jgi:aerotaxis receptor
MKINLPVTQMEKPFPKGKYLVSKTDLKGAVTYANDAFVELSGFSREELIGKNHNLVRHPDMPPQAFEDLWRTVKAGLPWRGVVKNRSKNGDHYWVDAFVVPVRENDQTIGYMSVRSEPSRDQVKQAEALYRKLNESKAKLDTGSSRRQGFGINARMGMTALAVALMLAGGAVAAGKDGLIAAFALSLVLVMGVSWSMLRSVIQPMRQAMLHFDHISQGNLTDEIDISGRSEAGSLLTALATMQVHLKVMLDEIMAASRAIDQRSSELQAEMIGVVTQSELQHDRVQSVASATEEFSQSVKEVAESADGTARAAVNSQSIVDNSQRNMEKSMEATTRVVQAVQASSSTITDLNQAILKIGDITQVIKEIADQTNLLALNAAIEAARAGETGRGFAVVADEVRKLAERTTSSTADISAMVTEIQNVTQQTVASMNHAVTEVEDGISMMRASGESLNQITRSSEEVTGMAQHIAAAAQEQASASEEVASNMEQISSLIESNMASAQQAKQATDELQNTAVEMEKIVAHFKIFSRK